MTSSVDLGRPWDLQLAMLATDLGRAAHAVLIRLLPPVAIGALFFPFRWPRAALRRSCCSPRPSRSRWR